MKRIGAGLAVILISIAALVLSPTKIEICTEQNFFGRLVNFSRLGSGHIDGRQASYCYGPSATSWALFSGSLVVGSLAIAVACRGSAGNPTS